VLEEEVSFRVLLTGLLAIVLFQMLLLILSRS